jgi:hypothetical protein
MLAVVAGTVFVFTASAETQSHSHACRPSQLGAGIVEPGLAAATGQEPTVVALHNRSRRSCSLYGYPLIELHDARGALPFVVTDRSDMMVTSARPTPVELSLDSDAFILFNKYRCDAGDRRVASAARIRLPNAPHSTAFPITLPRFPRIGYCGRGDPGSFLSVSPVEPTMRATTH